MKSNFFEPFKCFPKSAALMLVHPSWTLGLMALTALLSIGALLMGRHLGLPDQLQPDDIDGVVKQGMLNLAMLFPLELYFLPRWIIATDAGPLDSVYAPKTSDSKDNWRQLFEERWGRAFLARLMLGVATSIGFFLCLVPGILVLIFFGWTPWRVLLRGEPIIAAAKSCARSMAVLWPQVLMVATAIMLVVLVFNGFAATAASAIAGDYASYASTAAAAVSMVWMNAALLALYQWMEKSVSRDQGSGGKG
ncbi:MAG: hypothetical protein LBC63_04880 [Holophagales bacterium]|jgi:hypothetical protein|nr:hypothetical protein [Holophagales bacterium]